MKIAVIGARSIPTKFGGIGRYCQELYPQITERGHQVDLYVQSNHHNPAWFSTFIYQRMKVITLPSLSERRLSLTNVALATIWASFGNYDVIHFHGIAAAWFAWFAQLFSCSSIIVTCHQLESPEILSNPVCRWLLPWLEKMAISCVDETIVTSQELADYFWRKYRVCPQYIANAPTIDRADSDRFLNGAGDTRGRTKFAPRALANAPASLKETLHPKDAVSLHEQGSKSRLATLGSSASCGETPQPRRADRRLRRLAGIRPRTALHRFNYRQAFGLERNRYVLYLGTFEPNQRLDLLIKVFQKLQPPNWKLVLAGDISHCFQYTMELLQLVQQQENIIFTGEISDNFIAELVQGADVFVDPSTGNNLNSSIAILEAMRSGITIVASDTATHRQLIGRDRGLLFRSGQFDSLLMQLEYAMSRPNLLLAMAKKAQTYIAVNHNWDKVVYKNLFIYLQLTNSHRLLRHPMKGEGEGARHVKQRSPL